MEATTSKNDKLKQGKDCNLEIHMPKLHDTEPSKSEESLAGKNVKISRLLKNLNRASSVDISDSTKERLQNALDNDKYQKIMELFQKTEEMKTTHHEEYLEQFQNLREKLNGSSEFLQRTKKQLENLKFTYQKNIIERHKILDTGDCLSGKIPEVETKEDFTNYMEQVSKKIEDLQEKFKDQMQKKKTVIENYEDAYTKVLNQLQEIESGTYHSQKTNKDEV